MATAQMHKVIEHLRQIVLRDSGDCTDGQLLESFLSQGEQAAFEALVQRHGRMVLGVCRRLLNQAQDIEDAFQVTFLVLVRKAASLRSRRTIGDWLYGVAYHTALKARAAAVKRRVKERQAAAMAQRNAPEAIWQELQPLLDLELSRLPEKYRVPIVLCDLEGKTRKQAAQQLGWPEGTVSGRLSRARVVLANRLQRHGLRFSGGLRAILLSQHVASAGVPAALLGSTAKAATLVAAGQAAAVGILSAPVAALMEGVLKAMWLTKLKIATGVLLAVGLMGTGTGLLFVQPSAAGQGTQQAEPGKKDANRRGESKDGTPRDGQRRDRTAGDRPGPSILPPGIDRLDLSEAQRDKLAKLQKEFEEQLEIGKRKHAEAIEQARQNQDRQKAEEANQALRKEVGRLHEQAQSQLRQVLTEAQLRRLAELQRGQPGGGRPGFDLLRYLGQLDLRAEQREKVERLVKEVSEQQEVAQRKTQEAVEKAKENQDRAKVRELMEAHEQEVAKLHERLHAGVQQILTEEQRRRLAELVRQRAGGTAVRGIVQVLPPPLQERLGLTAEQQERVARLQKEMEGRLREILTEEQNRQVEQLRRGEAPSERRRQKE